MVNKNSQYKLLVRMGSYSDQDNSFGSESQFFFSKLLLCDGDCSQYPINYLQIPAPIPPTPPWLGDFLRNKLEKELRVVYPHDSPVMHMSHSALNAMSGMSCTQCHHCRKFPRQVCAWGLEVFDWVWCVEGTWLKFEITFSSTPHHPPLPHLDFLNTP